MLTLKFTLYMYRHNSGIGKWPCVREVNVHGKTHVVIVTVGGKRKQTYIHKTDKELYRTLEE